MNNRIFIMFLLLWLPLGALATEHPVSQSEFSTYKELAQTKLDATKESFQKDKEKIEVRLDNQDKRIGDLGLFLSIFGGFLTVLVLIAGWIGLTSVRSRAREEARIAADQWFDGKGIEVKAAAFEKRLSDSHESILKLTKQLEGLAEKAGARFEEIENSTRQKADELMSSMQEKISRKLASADKTELADTTLTVFESIEADALEQMDGIARSKPEAEYDYSDWNTRAFNALHKHDLDGAVHYWTAAANVNGATNNQAAQSLFNVGVVLGKGKRHEEAIAVYDELVSRYGNSSEASLREKVAQALHNKGISLSLLNRSEEAIVVSDELLLRFGNSQETVLREQVAGALYDKGVYLGWLNRNEEVIAVYDEVISRYGSIPEAVLRVVVAKALYNKGVSLDKLGRNEEEMAVYDNVVKRYGSAPEVELRELVAKALYNKGGTLGQLHRNEEAIAVYDELVSRYGNATEATLRVQIAKALNNKGHRLGKLNRNEEKLAAYDEVVSRYGSAPEVALREQVAKALNGKGFEFLCHAKSNWNDEVVRLNDLQRAAALFTSAENGKACQSMVLGNQAYTTFLLGQPDTARPLLNKALQQGGEELYKGTLDDLDIHPVPLDNEFRTLLEELWAEVKHKT